VDNFKVDHQKHLNSTPKKKKIKKKIPINTGKGYALDQFTNYNTRDKSIQKYTRAHGFKEKDVL
jgi:uncharacterized protein (DUF927 family)